MNSHFQVPFDTKVAFPIFAYIYTLQTAQIFASVSKLRDTQTIVSRLSRYEMCLSPTKLEKRFQLKLTEKKLYLK